MTVGEDDEGAFIALSDITLNLAFMALALFVLGMMLPHLKAEEDAKQKGITPGAMCFELSWPDGRDTDVDLWTKGPDGGIVGYSNRSSSLMDLLRDDMGKYADPGE